MLGLRGTLISFLVLASWMAGAEECPPIPTVPIDGNGWQLLPPPQTTDGMPAAEIIDLPSWPEQGGNAGAQAARLQAPGYVTVLSGQLDQDLVLTSDNSPALIHGALLIPPGKTLTLQRGAVLRLRPDRQATAPSGKNMPDPRQSGVLWVGGRLLADGLSGARVVLECEEGQKAGLFFSGLEISELRGADLNGIGITQSSAGVQWLSCQLDRTPYYALAGGAAFLIHCSIRRGGGVFATYQTSPWALLVKNCLFDQCREGLVFGLQTGSYALLVERNAFTNTQGANLRAMPSPAPVSRKKQHRGPELLIGENWYGTAVPEEIDTRIIDRRSQKNIQVWLNTRPPAEQAYTDVGAGVSNEVLAEVLNELAATRIRMLQTVGYAKETVQAKP